MRLFAQDAAFYWRVRVDETDYPAALRRLRQLEAIDRMRPMHAGGGAVGAGVGPEHVLRAQAAARGGGREGSGSAQQPCEDPPGSQWTKADAKRVLEGAPGEAVGGEGEAVVQACGYGIGSAGLS